MVTLLGQLQMAKFILCVAIIFLVIIGCIGPNGKHLQWTEPQNRLLLKIYYDTYPPDERHFERIKKMWDEEVPYYNYVSQQRLERRIYELRKNYWNEWLNRSGTERDQMEDTLVNIYKDTNNGHPQHAKRILEELLTIHPEYQGDNELIRTVVYRWYERFTPLGREIMASDVDWTPQRKAELMHIVDQVKEGMGNLHTRIKERWSRMHKYLNVNDQSLMKYALKLRKKYNHEPRMEEKLEAEKKYRNLFTSEANGTLIEESFQRGKKGRWTDEMNADIMHIDNEVRGRGLNLVAVIKDRWDRMQKTSTRLSGEVLLARARHLHKTGYTPRTKSVQDAKRKYESLPPIPPEVLSRQKGKRKAQQLPIRGGHQHEPPSPASEMTPEQWALFQKDMEEINASYTGHAHHHHHTFYYGSSSHTPIDQGHFAPLPDTPRPQLNPWYPGGSSNHTHQASSSTQPHFPNLYNRQWHPGSSSNYSQHPPQQ